MKWWLLAVLAACSVDERTKPTAPDMQPLADAYDNPTRVFDEATARELQARVEDKIKALTDLESLADSLETTLAAVDDDQRSARGKAPVGFTGDGFARVERICSGHGDPLPPIDKDANGYLALTVGYTEDGIDSVIYGGATGCAEQLEGRRLALAGDMNLYVGNALKLGDVPKTPVLFQLADFELTVNDVELVSGGFDFQVCRGTTSKCESGFVETLLSLEGGDTIVFFIDTSTGTGGFRAANGTWRCKFREGTCHDDADHVLTIPVYQL